MDNIYFAPYNNDEDYRKNAVRWESACQNNWNSLPRLSVDDDLLLCKKKFSERFPNISFEVLQRQNDNIRTYDTWTHYKHKITNQIYSWNYGNNKWLQNHANFQTRFLKLFV